MLYMINGSLEYNFVEILNDGHCCEFCYYPCFKTREGLCIVAIDQELVV